jgi:hypothetical protein
MKRRVALALAAAIVASLVGAVVAIATDHTPQRATKYQVYGFVGNRRFPIQEGSVITTGRREANGSCTFDEPTGVSVEMQDGGIGPRVRTKTDEDCRVVVDSIAFESDEGTPPPEGEKIEPKPAGGRS